MSTSVNVSNFISLQLAPDNYPQWREQALALAQSQDLDEHLTKDKSAPPEYTTSSTTSTDGSTVATQIKNPDYTAWLKADKTLAGWLKGTLSIESLGLVIGVETAYGVWQALKEAYAQDSLEREFNLRQQITYLRKANETGINEHLRTFKGLCDSLAAIGRPITDPEKVYHLLTSLGPDYEHFSTIMLKPPRPTYFELVSQLQNLDQRKNWFAAHKDNGNLSHIAFYGQKSNQQSKSNERFSSAGRGFQAQQGSFRPAQNTGQGQNEGQSGRHVFKRMTKAERERYRQETCQHCGMQGHIAQICWWNSKQRSQNDVLPQALAALTLDNTIAETEWIMDTGASAHMTGQGNKASSSERRS